MKGLHSQNLDCFLICTSLFNSRYCFFLKLNHTSRLRYHLLPLIAETHLLTLLSHVWIDVFTERGGFLRSLWRQHPCPVYAFIEIHISGRVPTRLSWTTTEDQLLRKPDLFSKAMGWKITDKLILVIPQILMLWWSMHLDQGSVAVWEVCPTHCYKSDWVPKPQSPQDSSCALLASLHCRPCYVFPLSVSSNRETLSIWRGPHVAFSPMSSGAGQHCCVWGGQESERGLGRGLPWGRVLLASVS